MTIQAFGPGRASAPRLLPSPPPSARTPSRSPQPTARYQPPREAADLGRPVEALLFGSRLASPRPRSEIVLRPGNTAAAAWLSRRPGAEPPGAVLARDDGRHLLLAMAEDQAGEGLSDALVAILAERARQRPVQYLIDLLGMLEHLEPPEGLAGPASCSLTLLAFDRLRGTGHGLILGEGCAHLTDPFDSPAAYRLGASNRRLVHLSSAGRLRADRPDSFGFQALPGQLVLLSSASDRLARRSPSALDEEAATARAVHVASIGLLPPLQGLRRFVALRRAAGAAGAITIAGSRT